MQAPAREEDHRVFVGSNLAVARTALGCSQAKWERDYGFSQTRQSNWEGGKHYPNPWFLYRICADYGLTMDWFYRGVLAGVSAERADDLRRARAESEAASRVG